MREAKNTNSGVSVKMGGSKASHLCAQQRCYAIATGGAISNFKSSDLKFEEY
jgi:hypothetical protein